MDASRFHRISDLKVNRTDWKIKVRLTRLWKSINNTTGDFKGYNMILLDDDKTHIHAFAGMDFVNGMDDNVLEEGKIYVISEFNVNDTDYKYSAVSNKKEIYFLKRTDMKPVEEDDEMIPTHKFELVALNALQDRVGDTKILTDVMGLVENTPIMQSRNTVTGPKDILLFTITDGSKKVKITVWSNLAHALKKELEKREGEDIIIILTSCGITEYKKQLQASTLSPSKFYINPDYDPVYNLRHRLNAVNESSVADDILSVNDCSNKKIPTYDLKQIVELRNSNLETLEVICHVSVCSLDTQSKWWFYSCDGCPGEVSLIDNTYKCNDCGIIVSYPDKRFKLSMYVTDPSETIQVFLFDREVRRLISTTVNSLIGKNLKDGKEDQFPDKLKTINGKKLTLTLSLNAKNLIHGNTVYFASDVIEEFTTSENCSTTHTSKADVGVPDSTLSDNVIGHSKDIKSSKNKRPHKIEDGANKKNKT